MAISFVQNVATYTAAGAGTTSTANSTVNTTVGNFLIMRYGNSGGFKLSGVSDTHTNPWQLDVSNGSNGAPAFASTKIITAIIIGDPITANHQSGVGTEWVVDEFSGLDPTTWFSAASAVKAVTGTSMTTTAVTVPANGLAIGCWGGTGVAGAVFTAGTGYTGLTTVGTSGATTVFGCFQVDSGSGGSYAPNGTSSTTILSARAFAAAYNAASTTVAKNGFFALL